MISSDVIPSRRERRRTETRARLLSAALELIAGKGYAETSIDDIAALADVARGTAVNYFPRKEDYLAALFAERQEAFRRLLETIDPSRPTLDRILRALDVHARSYEDDRRNLRPIVREWVRAGGPMLASGGDSIEPLIGIIAAGKQAGEVRSDLNPNDAATLIIDAFLGALARWAGQSEDDASLRRPLMRATRLLVRAFVSENSTKE